MTLMRRSITAALLALWYPGPGGNGPALFLARLLLLPLSLVYGVVVLLRGLLYDAGLLRAFDVGVPVVSVGSISVGGAGKTPLVIWLIERCRALGRTPVVVSRGYGAAGEGVTVIETGSRQGADEALMVVARTGCPVVTAADRVAAGRTAIERFAPDLIIIDDGFQHRRMSRSVDLVLAPVPDERWLLPAGPLRESRRALGRAGLVVRTETRTVGLVASASDPDSRAGAVAGLAGRRVLAVAGLARPEAFLTSVRGSGASEVLPLLFPDHQVYGEREVGMIRRSAAACDLIVTTEKDLVKLGDADLGGSSVVALRVRSLPDAAEKLDELIAGLDRNRGH